MSSTPPITHDPLKNFDTKEGYDRFRIDCYGIDPATGNPINPNINSEGSRRFDSTQSLLDASARLIDGKSLLGDCIAKLSDPDATQRSSNKAAKIIQDSIMPLMDVVAGMSQDAATRVSPIASGKYAHRREDTRRKREAEEAGTKDDAKLVMVNEFVKNKGSPDASSLQSSPAVQASKVTSRSAKKRRGNALPLTVPDPPPPKNGTTYGMGEFIAVMAPYPKYSHKRSAMLNKVVGSYVKRDKATAYRALKASEEGKRYAFDEPWPHVGRKPLMNDAELDSCAKLIVSTPGEKRKKDQVNAMLVEKERQTGRLPDPKKKYNATTVNNYLAAMATRGNISLQGKSIAKTNARYTKERSVIGSMSLILVVAMTHFYVVEEEDVEWRQTIKQLPKEDRLLYDMVCAFHGNKPVRVRPQHLILNYLTLTRPRTTSARACSQTTILMLG